jgi:hypothetical protein
MNRGCTAGPMNLEVSGCLLRPGPIKRDSGRSLLHRYLSLEPVQPVQSNSCWPQRRNADRNSAISRHKTRIISLAATLSSALPNANRGMSRISPRSRSFWQIDKNNVGILPQAVEHDLLTIGSDIECSHRRVLSEMCKLARRFRRHIENPKVLRWV